MTTDDVLTLGEIRFPINVANFRRITDDGQGHPGWEFNICTGPPLNPPADPTEAFLYGNGVRFYAEGDPIPLPDTDDLTGVELELAEPSDPNSGEVYFTLYVAEHGDITDLHLRFLERRGFRYLLEIEALAPSIEEEPLTLRIRTWIERLPAGRYGDSSG